MNDQTTALHFAYGYGTAAVLLIVLAVALSRRTAGMTLGSLLLGGVGVAFTVATSQAVYAYQYLIHA